MALQKQVCRAGKAHTRSDRELRERLPRTEETIVWENSSHQSLDKKKENRENSPDLNRSSGPVKSRMCATTERAIS